MFIGLLYLWFLWSLWLHANTTSCPVQYYPATQPGEFYEVANGSYKLIENFDLDDLSEFRFTLDYHFAGIELLERR